MLVQLLTCVAFLLLVQVSSAENIRSIFRNGPCLKNEYRCLNDKCISKHLFCNSNDDCGDNSDESYCKLNEEDIDRSWSSSEEDNGDNYYNGMRSGSCPAKVPYFRCRSPGHNYDTYYRCIPMSWKCDQVNDCYNSEDESGCDYNNRGQGITAFKLQSVSRSSQTWIERKRKADRKLQKWGLDLPRKAVALYLSYKSTKNNNTYIDEMAYELSSNFLFNIAMKKIDDIPIADIASYINAFLVTCINPREFYVLDLVKELRTRLDNMNSTNAFALLAMCNAHEIIKTEDVQKLENAFLVANQKHRIDTMAMIVLALACASNQHDSAVDQEDLSNLVLELKKKQYRNGTVENVKSTALVLQALLASEREPDEDNFDEKKALQQILRSQEADGSFGNLANTYFALPVLNGLSLINISTEHCPSFIRDEREGLQHLKDQVGEKWSVKYSLWVGDDRFIQRTLTMSVPTNTSFYGIMEYASALDNNYRFEYNVRNRKPFIYSLYRFMDDPEKEMFWSLHRLTNETSGEAKMIHKSPADVYPTNNDHLVYWYKSEA